MTSRDPACRRRLPFGAALIVVLYGACGASADAQTASSAVSCEAARVIGAATLRRDGQDLAIRPGTRIAQSDDVATARESRLEIVCGDGSRLVLGADSRVRLARFAGAAARPSGLVELFAGIVRFVLPSAHRWERFDVVTRTAVASVRSTTWIVESAGDRSSVFVVDGGVLVSSRATQGQVFLQPGEGVDIGTGPTPLRSNTWGRARADDVVARTSLP